MRNGIRISGQSLGRKPKDETLLDELFHTRTDDMVDRIEVERRFSREKRCFLVFIFSSRHQLQPEEFHVHRGGRRLPWHGHPDAGRERLRKTAAREGRGKKPAVYGPEEGTGGSGGCVNTELRRKRRSWEIILWALCLSGKA